MSQEPSKRDAKGRLSGKVAQIVSTRQLVINVGFHDGVEKGMVFAVLNRRGVDVRDPDNPSIEIGSFEIPKVFVKVTQVLEKASLASTYKTRTVGGSLAIPDLFQPPRQVVETLKAATEDQRHAEELEEEESYVRVGDPVVEVPAETAKERAKTSSS